MRLISSLIQILALIFVIRLVLRLFLPSRPRQQTPFSRSEPRTPEQGDFEVVEDEEEKKS